MASNKIQRSGPIALTTTTTTNLFNPPTLTGGTNVGGANTYLVVRHIRVTNKTTNAVQVALWLGLTGANTAGTEFAFAGIASAGTLTNGVSIAANSYLDWYGMIAIEAADFIVGGCATATAATINIEYEIGIR